MTKLVRLIELEDGGDYIEVTIEYGFLVIRLFAHGDQLQITRRTPLTLDILWEIEDFNYTKRIIHYEHA
jgi:hypothetical protein